MTGSKIFFCLLIALFLLPSCSQPLPDEMPDIGLNIEEITFNQDIKLTAFKSCNTYKSGDEICVEVENLSDKEWNFHIVDDVYTYELENNEWKKVEDKLIHLGSVNQLLSPKKDGFPSNGDIILVKPNVSTSKSHYMRIIIILHENIGDQTGQTTGGYIDVLLR